MFKSVDPKPEFPKQEEEVLKFWREQNIFKKSLEKNVGKPQYIIYDGPPYANARPPLHTMLPMVFKDIVGRYQTMRGYHVPRQAGWDTHGLPIEVQAEKQLELSGKPQILSLVPGDPRASVEEFNRVCREMVMKFKEEWDEYLPRVGYWTDTEDPYITYDAHYMENVWGVFKRIWDKDLVYKGYKVLPYCPRCGTVLASHEVAQEYHDKKDVSVFVSFPLKENPGRSLLAWTTTPWTLPGNVALAVGKDIDYVVVKTENHEYILAKSLLGVLQEEYEIIEELTGADLVGLQYESIFPEVFEDSENAHQVFAGEFVSTEDGTGIVHLAPMYGEDDFNLAKEQGLPMIHTVGPDGKFLENVAQFAGEYAQELIGPLLSDLQEKQRLYKKLTINHSYPFCWRCKTALMYYAQDSWFIAMSALREQLVANNAQVDWIPGHIKDGRFGDFVAEARDWAVSRDRFWGVPVPIWTSESGKNICISSFEELKSLAKNPELVGEDFDPHRPYVDDIVLVKDGEEYVREESVFDIWFESGAMPYGAEMEQRGLFPADYIAEAVDQTRGWFYVLQAIATAVRNETPYKRVVCLGHIVDEDGKKMSKSLGNVFDPWEMLNTHGADSIRWWFYTVNAPGENKALSHKELQTSFRRSLLLLWNVFNYFVTYVNVEEFETPSEVQRKNLQPKSVLDQWILSRLDGLVGETTELMDKADFQQSGRLIEEFISDLSTWYLRRSRKRSDQDFFQTMYEALITLATVMAPYTPFISETFYQVLKRDDQSESVHLLDWPEVQGRNIPELEQAMSATRSAVELGLSLRSEAGIKVRQPLQSAVVQFKKKTSYEAGLAELMQDELNVESITNTEINEGLKTKESDQVVVALNTEITPELMRKGDARELLRHLQQLRKKKGLQPGEVGYIVATPEQKTFIKDLAQDFPSLLTDSYLKLEPKDMLPKDEHEISLSETQLLLDIVTESNK